MAFERDLGVRFFDLRLGEIGPALIDLRLKRCRIELREKLPLFHAAVEVSVQARDDARDLAADLHRRDRRQRAGRSDGHRDVAAIGFFNSILLVFFTAAASECGD